MRNRDYILLKESLFAHPEHKFSKSKIWGTQKQYAFVFVYIINVSYKTKNSITYTLQWRSEYSRLLHITSQRQQKAGHTICFNSISGTAPQYLSDLLQPYTPARQLRSASDTRTFVTHPCKHKNI